jgi:cephalosporin-C deacetylase-like acetyl esterase
LFSAGPFFGRLLAVLLVQTVGVLGSASVFAANANVLDVRTERPDALYKTGEEVTFLVRAKANGQNLTDGAVNYVLDDEGPNQFEKGTLNLGEEPVRVKASMSKPGFLRLRVTRKTTEGKTIRSIATAAVSPEDIKPSLPVPDDFDEFWRNQKAELAKTPAKASLTPLPRNESGIEAFDVHVDCLGSAPVSGYFARPEIATPKSLPAVLWVHGAGVRSSILSQAVLGAKQGMLSMDINAHGIPNGKPKSYYVELSKGALKGYRHRGRESRETSYFVGMYLRIVRAIDFLTAQPEWNGKVLAVSGHSQGGGQSLVAGGLDERVTFIAAGVPAMCDHSGLAANRVNGWPKLVPHGKDGQPNPQVLEASRYVDAVNFASRCKADAMMSIGFIDTVCPPTTNYAAYNLLRGQKRAINEPRMGHAAPGHIKQAFLEGIVEHARSR